MFTLFNIIFLWVAAIIDGVIGRNTGAPNMICYTLYFLATLTPALAVTVRRLRDAGKSGWMILINLIPIVGQIWLLILLIKESEPEDIQQEMDSTVFEPVNAEVLNVSIWDLKCPDCGKNDLIIIGLKGAIGRSIVNVLFFGAIGNIIAGNNAAKNTQTKPVQYQCKSCKHKFYSEPLPASPEEILTEPCIINFKRLGNFVGAALPQFIYLNGTKIGAIKNGNAISFQTNVKHNTLFVMDIHGVAFKDVYKFEAQPSASVYVRFDRKFLKS
ncbi:hypothetical protein FACS189426_10110 [Bacteroidia bacterium]|nr:hypothetical protein FACS189426_10110 [Bacteroidia bacterium]GHV70915.1 hypothetical protein FACS189420_3970 [Bacteroidia bacterium]